MSSLWTPDGERPVNATSSSPAGTPADPGPSPSAATTPGGAGQDGPSAEQLEQLRQQLAETPAAIVVANHCFGLFELAALHLSLSPPQIDEAQIAIDALAAIVESLEGRLGDVETQLIEGLTQLRLAFVQIKQATDTAAEATSNPTAQN
jgi:hypothetical protein